MYSEMSKVGYPFLQISFRDYNFSKQHLSTSIISKIRNRTPKLYSKFILFIFDVVLSRLSQQQNTNYAGNIICFSMPVASIFYTVT